MSAASTTCSWYMPHGIGVGWGVEDGSGDMDAAGECEAAGVADGDALGGLSLKQRSAWAMVQLREA
jgi:hypothetical protein